MNRTPDVERVLRDYFAEDGLPAPDDVLDVVEARIRRQPQRRAWPFPGRTSSVTQLKLLAGLAAAIAIAAAGYSLLPSLGIGGPGPLPTPVVTPSPTPPASSPSSPAVFQCEEGTGCAGPLSAGAHATTWFLPSFSYTVPADWINPIDLPTLVGLTPNDHPADLVLIWSDVVPAERTATCTLRAKPGAGTSADGWVSFLVDHPGLAAENVQALTIGGRYARSVDVRSFGGWTAPCADDREGFVVPIVKTPDGAPGDGYGVRIGAEARVYAIEVGDQTIVITVYAYQGSGLTIAAAAGIAEPVVNSISFGAP